jgi:hypothetical protein
MNHQRMVFERADDPAKPSPSPSSDPPEQSAVSTL